MLIRSLICVPVSLLALLVVVGALSGCADPQARVAGVGAISGNADAGAELFAKHCTGCHGDDGRKVKRHDLMGDKARGRDPARLAQFILVGEDGMPSFADRLSDTQVAHLVAWIRRGPELPPAQE